MNIVEVTNSSTAQQFIDLPRALYKNDPNWICPLDNDIKAIFNPSLNNYHNHGVCTRWILKDDNGKLIGRIAAFINNEKAYKNDKPTGCVGFFECINNKGAAFLLFDTAKSWLKDKGMQAMEGPVNFGENDKYWGLLIEGFKPPSMGMNYNPPYYIDFFESYGFVKKYDQFTNFLDITIPFTERFTKIADWVMKKPGYSFRHFEKNQFEKFAADFAEVYNDAWSEFENFMPIKYETIKESFRQMKPIMDEKIIWFAYYNEEPIAFVISLPDINPVLKHVNGKLDLWSKLKFFWYKQTTTAERLRMIIMGCKKKYQNKGIESALIRCLQVEVVPRGTVKGVELAWVGDFNDKMMAIHEATGAKKDKVHRTYKYSFDK
ncbi:MAG: GNAT family N-acetyltransferase [Sphingobacteriales bacterium]